MFSSDDTPFSKAVRSAIETIFSYDILTHWLDGALYEAHVWPLCVFLLLLIMLRAVVDVCKYLDRTGYSTYLNCCYTHIGTNEDGNGSNSNKKKEKAKRGMESLMETEVTTRSGVEGSRERRRCCGMGGGGVWSLVKKLYRDEESIPEDSVAKAVTYPRAVQRNLIKGLGERNGLTHSLALHAITALIYYTCYADDCTDTNLSFFLFSFIYSTLYTLHFTL